MYIKRDPLGQGNLTFGKRRRRFPVGWIMLYLAVLTAALVVYLRADFFQPRVLAMIGPDPTPTSLPSDLTALGDAAYMDGDLATAIDYYRQASQIEPNNLDILDTYGHLLVLTAEPENLLSAEAIGDQMVLLAPEDPRGYTVKARALDWQSRYEEAQIEALRAIDLDPNYALGHAVLAEAYADLGRLRQAREEAEVALQLDPYHVEVRRNYAYVLEFYGDYQGAIQQYIQALQLHPNRLDLLYGLAHNYRGAGQTDRAIETFAQIAMSTPDDPLLYVDWGRTYYEMRDDQAAQEMLEQAVFLVCQQNQPDVPEEERVSCPYVDGNVLFEESDDNPWYIGRREPRPSQIPWDAENRDVPPYIMLTAWNRLGQVYLTRRNYEDAVAILAEAVAWGETQDEKSPSYTPVPIESYYVMATAYYYMNMCQMAVPLAAEAMDIYHDRFEQQNREDPNALRSTLCIFYLCSTDRYVNNGQTYIHDAPGFTDGIPDGYTITDEDCTITRGAVGDSEEDGDE